MASAIFEWDDENADHIAQHHVETDEAEAVFDNKPLVLRSQVVSASLMARAMKVAT